MAAITIPARLSCLGMAQEFLESILDGAGMDGLSKAYAATAVEEVFMNISSYAYYPDEGDVTVYAEVFPDKLVLEFCDNGKPYDPLRNNGPDISIPAEKRELGGLGIVMVKNMMDSVKYRYEDGKNILTLEKLI